MSSPENATPQPVALSFNSGPSLRVWLAVALIAAATALAHFGRPTTRLSSLEPPLKLETTIPERFGHWRLDPTAAVVIPAPDVKAALDQIYEQVLARTYVNPQGYRIMLSVAYGGDQSDGLKVHRPERCYQGQGFEILGSRRDQVDLGTHSIPVRRVSARAHQVRYEPITYWMLIADQPVESGIEQKIAQMRYGLRGLIPDGMLMRISSIDRDEQRAYAMQDEFIKELSQQVDKVGAPRLFGRPN